jgi:DNA-binding SARP family transcriptional activator/tetratricopeptide (TPR) repeat protein
MEFRLLGPLEVVDQGIPLSLGSLRQRIVLTMLLFEANRIVPVTRLVDGLWGDEPPATARTQIQTCISALRLQLNQHGSRASISTRPPGYQINVPESDLDVCAFRQLSNRGLSAVRDDPENAVRDLREALALWRGPAAAGIDSTVVQAIATRLNEDYFSVLDECLDVELELGRHHELTGELSALVKQHPLRERTRAQHMLSLYRSGRQADALESFQEAREIFSEQLGLEPSQELGSLQHAILTKDPRLEHERMRKPKWHSGNTQTVPRQLPPATADLTGRDEMLGQMLSALTEATRGTAGNEFVPILGLVGKGGVGKTALAVNLAHAARDLYPDGQLFVQLQDPDGRPVSASSLQERFLRAFGMPATLPPDGAAERTEIYRTMLGERRVLILLDDAVDVGQVTPLIPGSARCAVIITSRVPLPGLQGVNQYEVNDLDESASIELLTKIIGPERVRAEPSAMLDLVRFCAYLPLALRIVGAKLQHRRHWTISEMVRRMADEGRRLDELVLSEIGIRATLALSYKNLSRDAQRLFVLLGLVGGTEFAPWVSAALLDKGCQEAGDLLDILVDCRLVEVRLDEDQTPRFRLHELVRIYALERLADDEPIVSRARALRRLLECWLSLATEAHRRLYGGHFAILHCDVPTWRLPEEDLDQVLTEPMNWFRRERTGLVAAVLQAGKAGLSDVCWDLAVTSVTLFEKEFQVEDWRQTHEIALEAASAAGSRRGEAAVLYSLGLLAIRERPEKAPNYLSRALTIFDQIEDIHGQALTLGVIAFIDRISGRQDKALEGYQAVLDAARQVGDRVCEVDALTNIAQIRMDREEFAAVEELLDRALMICGTITAYRTMAQAEHRLADFLIRTGRLELAKRSLESVLEAVRKDGDHIGEGYALVGLGTIHIRKANYDLAQRDLAAAIDLSGRARDNILHMCALLSYAELWLAQGELDRTRAVIEDAHAVLGHIGAAPAWRARLLALTARADEKDGNAAAASLARREALHLVGSSDPALRRSLEQSIRAGNDEDGNPELADAAPDLKTRSSSDESGAAASTNSARCG